MPAVELSHPDKVLFPDAGLTKAGLAEHYRRVAGVMLPHVRDRPVSLQCFPRGVAADGYFMKDVPAHAPAWLRRVEVPKRGGTVTHVLADDADALVWLAGQNCITPHVWTSRVDRLDEPDRLIFDLDPEDHDFAFIRAVARALGAFLQELGFTPHAMVTGSRGIHVVCPLRRGAGFEEVKAFARDAAARFAAQDPERLTVEHRKEKRRGRLFVDALRNGYAQTAVPPWAVRARAHAPVAVPLAWEELDDDRLQADTWTVAEVPERLAAVGDPWPAIRRHAKALGPARRALERLAG